MKKLKCPNCGQKLVTDVSGVWLDKICVCSNCLIPFVIKADRQFGFFYIHKISKPSIRLKDPMM